MTMNQDMNGPLFWRDRAHRHSGIRYVTPAQRHAGTDREVLRARHALYEQARALHPRRWSGPTRDWSHIDVVILNPERTEVLDPAMARVNKRSLAA